MAAIALSMIAAAIVSPAHAETAPEALPAPYEMIKDMMMLQQRVEDRVFHLRSLTTDKLYDVHFGKYNADWQEMGAETISYRFTFVQGAKKDWAMVGMLPQNGAQRRQLVFVTVPKGPWAGDYFIDPQTKEGYRILSEERAAPQKVED